MPPILTRFACRSWSPVHPGPNKPLYTWGKHASSGSLKYLNVRFPWFNYDVLHTSCSYFHWLITFYVGSLVLGLGHNQVLPWWRMSILQRCIILTPELFFASSGITLCSQSSPSRVWSFRWSLSSKIVLPLGAFWGKLSMLVFDYRFQLSCFSRNHFCWHNLQTYEVQLRNLRSSWFMRQPATLNPCLDPDSAFDTVIVAATFSLNLWRQFLSQTI